jgi:hypothetical protein
MSMPTEVFFVVIADHWNVPGTKVSVHRTIMGATDRAIKWVNAMLADLDEDDLNFGQVATVHNWESLLTEMPADADVWIAELFMED